MSRRKRLTSYKLGRFWAKDQRASLAVEQAQAARSSGVPPITADMN